MRSYDLGMVSLAVAALDVASARAGIGKDIRVFAESGVFGWVVLTVVFALPLISMALLLRRRWLAMMPLLISLAIFSVWFLYYATNWWSNPGQGAWAPAFLLVFLGWLVVCAEIWRGRGRL
jgi:hypothetical protein